MARAAKKPEGGGILDELVAVTGAKREAGESAQDYTKRLVMIVDKLSDDDWKSLGELTQEWVNDAVTAVDARKSVELPPGLKADAEELDGGDAGAGVEPEEVEEVEEGEEGEEPMSKSTEKSRASKKKPAAAKLGKKPKPKPTPMIGKKAVVGKSIKKTKPTASKKAPRSASSGELRAGTKSSRVIEMLRNDKGATVAEIAKVFDWEPHTARAVISVQTRRAGLKVTSEKNAKRGRVYRIET